MRPAIIAVLAFAAAGCGVIKHSSGLMPKSTTAYRDVISDDDHIRLRDWRISFVAGLDAAR